MVAIDLDSVNLEFTVRRYKRLSLKEFLVRGMFSKAANPVIHVQAANYIEAASITEGTTYPGDVSRSIVHTGRNEWQIRIEPWKTE